MKPIILLSSFVLCLLLLAGCGGGSSRLPISPPDDSNTEGNDPAPLTREEAVAAISNCLFRGQQEMTWNGYWINEATEERKEISFPLDKLPYPSDASISDWSWQFYIGGFWVYVYWYPGDPADPNLKIVRTNVGEYNEDIELVANFAVSDLIGGEINGSVVQYDNHLIDGTRWGGGGTIGHFSLTAED
jgi:hypothetical protein